MRNESMEAWIRPPALTYTLQGCSFQEPRVKLELEGEEAVINDFGL